MKQLTNKEKKLKLKYQSNVTCINLSKREEKTQNGKYIQILGASLIKMKLVKKKKYYVISTLANPQESVIIIKIIKFM